MTKLFFLPNSTEESLMRFLSASSAEVFSKTVLSRQTFQLFCAIAEIPIKLKRKAKRIFMIKLNQIFSRILFVNCKCGPEYRKIYHWFWSHHCNCRIVGLFLSRQAALVGKIAR